MPSRLLPLVLGSLLVAASCEDKPTFAEFEARTWPVQCEGDQDCVLLPVPCDHCGTLRPLSASSRASYQESAGAVSCDDYTLHEEIDCGSAAPMEATCVASRCTARVASPPEDSNDQASPAQRTTPDECGALRVQTAAILETPAEGCESDDDCGCYPALIDCGGVRDAASAEALRLISLASQEASCGYRRMNGARFNCAPRRCIAACNDGNCGRRR